MKKNSVILSIIDILSSLGPNIVLNNLISDSFNLEYCLLGYNAL
jgi:hypothetical protein